jgi:hypothetical protein
MSAACSAAKGSSSRSRRSRASDTQKVEQELEQIFG